MCDQPAQVEEAVSVCVWPVEAAHQVCEIGSQSYFPRFFALEFSTFLKLWTLVAASVLDQSYWQRALRLWNLQCVNHCPEAVGDCSRDERVLEAFPLHDHRYMG